MDLTDHLTHAAVRRVQLNLAVQIAQIDVCTVMVLGNDLVAGAVIAQRLAKRNVNVHRQWQSLANGTLPALLQGQHVFVLTEGIDKTVGGGIRGVTGSRYIKPGEQFRGYNGHVVPS